MLEDGEDQGVGEWGVVGGLALEAGVVGRDGLERERVAAAFLSGEGRHEMCGW
jgi:hypothetical protein